ncbi:MAG: SRPBCC family protein [Chloroflexota bacterium]
MTELHFETTINRPIEAVFNLIADLPHYDQWLTPSNLYASMTQYSRLPIERGTTYVDGGKYSRMEGRITEFESPKRVHFRQANVSIMGALDIEICYALESIGGGTHLTRDVTVRPTGMYKLLQGYLVNSIRKENERILAVMKAHLEKT